MNICSPRARAFATYVMLRQNSSDPVLVSRLARLSLAQVRVAIRSCYERARVLVRRGEHLGEHGTYRPGTHDTRDLRSNAVFRIVKPMPMGAPWIEPGKGPKWGTDSSVPPSIR
jgi:hypothetical protein